MPRLQALDLPYLILTLFATSYALSAAAAAAAAAANSTSPPSAHAAPLPLRFTAQDRTFKIVQFTDLHLGEREDLDTQSREVGIRARAAAWNSLNSRSGLHAAQLYSCTCDTATTRPLQTVHLNSLFLPAPATHLRLHAVSS